MKPLKQKVNFLEEEVQKLEEQLQAQSQGVSKNHEGIQIEATQSKYGVRTSDDAFPIVDLNKSVGPGVLKSLDTLLQKNKVPNVRYAAVVFTTRRSLNANALQENDWKKRRSKT